MQVSSNLWFFIDGEEGEVCVVVDGGVPEGCVVGELRVLRSEKLRKLGPRGIAAAWFHPIIL